MSSNMRSLRPVSDGLACNKADHSTEYGVESTMYTGLNSTVKDKAASFVHPLQYSEEHWQENRDKLTMMTARNMQGLHMPLKLGMERFAAKQVSRLPCMAANTSNLMMDTLTGDDECISVEDVFNHPSEWPERAGHPHMLMEKKLGIFQS